jgi:hypothetical protein
MIKTKMEGGLQPGPQETPWQRSRSGWPRTGVIALCGIPLTFFSVLTQNYRAPQLLCDLTSYMFSLQDWTQARP